MTEPVRPDVLCYPSPTTIRFVILVVAALSAGLFAGTYVHNVVNGTTWQRQVRACYSVQDRTTMQRCTAEAEHTRGTYAVSGLAAGALACLIVLYAAPPILERRRRLRPAAAKFATAKDRFARIAREAGLPRPPRLMTGPATLRDAFSYGVPGRYRVVLPLGMMIRPGSDTFRAVAAHELAHVRHRDVTVAWLARSVGYAVVPVLAAPLVLAVVTRDLSGMAGYVIRALLLGAVIVLSRAAILRSREYDADLRAARHGTDRSVLSQALETVRSPVRRGPLANHPPAEDRVKTLRQPERAAHAGFLDALTVAFLVGLVPPLIDDAVIPLLTGTTEVGLTDVVSALLIGSLAGGTLGLALWRSALLRKLTGERYRLAPVVAGVFLGYLAGGAASLAEYGGGYDERLGVITAAVLAGATVTTAGLGELWAAAAGRIRNARTSWLAATVLSGALFAVVLWASLTTAKLIDDGGWNLARQFLPEYFSRVPVVIASLVLAAAAGWALWASRSGGTAPAWLLESGPRDTWPPERTGPVAPAIAAALAGVAVLVGYRIEAGPATDTAAAAQRFDVYVLIAVGAGVAATLALALTRSTRGSGAALLAVPLTTILVMIGLIVSNTVYGGALTPAFVGNVLEKPFGLAVPASVLAGMATARLRPRWLMPIVAAALSTVTALAVIGARDALVPVVHEAATATVDEAAGYRDRIAPLIYQDYVTIAQKRATILTDRTLTAQDRAIGLYQDVFQPLQTLYAVAGKVVPAGQAAWGAHARCLLALHDLVEAVRVQTLGLANGDAASAQAGQAQWQTAAADMRSWYQLTKTL